MTWCMADMWNLVRRGRRSAAVPPHGRTLGHGCLICYVQQRDFAQGFGLRGYKTLTGHITTHSELPSSCRQRPVSDVIWPGIGGPRSTYPMS